MRHTTMPLQLLHIPSTSFRRFRSSGKYSGWLRRPMTRWETCVQIPSMWYMWRRTRTKARVNLLNASPPELYLKVETLVIDTASLWLMHATSTITTNTTSTTTATAAAAAAAATTFSFCLTVLSSVMWPRHFTTTKTPSENHIIYMIGK